MALICASGRIFAADNKFKVMGLNVKKAIKVHGLEVREVAKRMGITPTGLSQHINGNPTVGVLERIAGAIGCDISELFDSVAVDELTALVQYKGAFYKATTIVELEGVVSRIKGLQDARL